MRLGIFSNIMNSVVRPMNILYRMTDEGLGIEKQKARRFFMAGTNPFLAYLMEKYSEYRGDYYQYDYDDYSSKSYNLQRPSSMNLGSLTEEDVDNIISDDNSKDIIDKTYKETSINDAKLEKSPSQLDRILDTEDTIPTEKKIKKPTSKSGVSVYNSIKIQEAAMKNALDKYTKSLIVEIRKMSARFVKYNSMSTLSTQHRYIPSDYSLITNKKKYIYGLLDLYTLDKSKVYFPMGLSEIPSLVQTAKGKRYNAIEYMTLLLEGILTTSMKYSPEKRSLLYYISKRYQYKLSSLDMKFIYRMPIISQLIDITSGIRVLGTTIKDIFGGMLNYIMAPIKLPLALLKNIVRIEKVWNYDKEIDDVNKITTFYDKNIYLLKSIYNAIRQNGEYLTYQYGIKNESPASTKIVFGKYIEKYIGAVRGLMNITNMNSEELTKYLKNKIGISTDELADQHEFLDDVIKRNMIIPIALSTSDKRVRNNLINTFNIINKSSIPYMEKLMLVNTLLISNIGIGFGEMKQFAADAFANALGSVEDVVGNTSGLISKATSALSSTVSKTLGGLKTALMVGGGIITTKTIGLMKDLFAGKILPIGNFKDVIASSYKNPYLLGAMIVGFALNRGINYLSYIYEKKSTDIEKAIRAKESGWTEKATKTTLSENFKKGLENYEYDVEKELRIQARSMARNQGITSAIELKRYEDQYVKNALNKYSKKQLAMQFINLKSPKERESLLNRMFSAQNIMNIYNPFYLLRRIKQRKQIYIRKKISEKIKTWKDSIVVIISYLESNYPELLSMTIINPLTDEEMRIDRFLKFAVVLYSNMLLMDDGDALTYNYIMKIFYGFISKTKGYLFNVENFNQLDAANKEKIINELKNEYAKLEKSKQSNLKKQIKESIATTSNNISALMTKFVNEGTKFGLGSTEIYKTATSTIQNEIKNIENITDKQYQRIAAANPNLPKTREEYLANLKSKFSTIRKEYALAYVHSIIQTKDKQLGEYLAENLGTYELKYGAKAATSLSKILMQLRTELEKFVVEGVKNGTLTKNNAFIVTSTYIQRLIPQLDDRTFEFLLIKRLFSLVQLDVLIKHDLIADYMRFDNKRGLWLRIKEFLNRGMWISDINLMFNALQLVGFDYLTKTTNETLDYISKHKNELNKSMQSIFVKGIGSLKNNKLLNINWKSEEAGEEAGKKAIQSIISVFKKPNIEETLNKLKQSNIRIPSIPDIMTKGGVGLNNVSGSAISKIDEYRNKLSSTASNAIEKLTGSEMLGKGTAYGLDFASGLATAPVLSGLYTAQTVGEFVERLGNSTKELNNATEKLSYAVKMLGDNASSIGSGNANVINTTTSQNTNITTQNISTNERTTPRPFVGDINNLNQGV